MRLLHKFYDSGKGNYILFPFSIFLFMCSILFAGCAKMGSPDGGWYDEKAPVVVGCVPNDYSVDVKAKKINIYFNEFVTIANSSENVVVSPPQLEAPEIRSYGKHIQVQLKDSLKANTTYTIDFSDAISDNNESNPLGNYAYTFSTGSVIDTMQVSGYVLESENLEPIKGILVGLYNNLSDTAFQKLPLLRVSRTDSRGHFIIKGVSPGRYRVYALQDADGNYLYSQKSEKLAFNTDVIVPSCKSDIRQDTLWTDSLHIKAIDRVGYTHFMPDNIVLKAFTAEVQDRFFLKSERKDANHFSLFFSYGNAKLPVIKGLNFNSDDAFIIESSEKKDTVTYWLKDTSLVNQDTLRFEMQSFITDTLGVLRNQTDTLEVLAKTSFAKRQKNAQKELEKWQKEQDKRKDKGEEYETKPALKALEPEYKVPSSMCPDKNINILFPSPLAKLDTAAIHLYSKHDTLWYRAPFEINKLKNRYYEIKAEWRPDIEYSLEIDSAAFEDIYGKYSGKYKQGFKVRSLDEFSSLFLNIDALKDSNVVVQLLDVSDKVIKEVMLDKGTAEFYYIDPGKYYVRLFIDSNKNKLWDTGDYSKGLQAETVYYYPQMIECRAKWDITKSWNPLETPLYRQKPLEITKQKPDKEKKIKERNAKRARDLGIIYYPKS